MIPARSSSVSSVVPKTVAKPVPKPVSKPVAKPAVKPVAKPLGMAEIRALMRAADKPSPKQIVVVAKPKPKAQPKIQTPAKTVSIVSQNPAASSNSSGSANFSPDESSAVVSPSNLLSVGQPANFSSDPKTHYRLGFVLGRSAEVRFTPLRADWNFSDGATATGARVTHSFDPGFFDVEVVITYSISYRLEGQANWIADPGQIGMPAIVSVEVNDQPTLPSEELTSVVLAKTPLLVSVNCLSNRTAIGCF